MTTAAAGATCPNCGAGFAPDVRGACRYCQAQLVVSDQPLNTELLVGHIRQILAAPGGPEQLAQSVNQVLADCAEVTPGRHGRSQVTFHIVDQTITLNEDKHGVSGEAVHEVRGVVLARTPLDLAEAARVLATSLSRAATGRPDIAADLARAL